MLITDNDIESMRGTTESAMPSSAVEVERTAGTARMGAASMTGEDGQTFACRLSPLQGNEKEIATQIHPEAKWRLDYPQSVTLAETSAVRIGSETYEIAYLQQLRSWDISRMAYLMKS